jgi:chemotaxis protein methyltransferase CheR
VVLPPLVARRDHGVIYGWSAACSTGEEPYTIAMTLCDQFGADSARRVRLLASDLSTKALAAARAGVYKTQRIADVPRDTARKYFENAPALPAGSMRVAGAIRQLVDFQQLNLLDPMPPRSSRTPAPLASRAQSRAPRTRPRRIPPRSQREDEARTPGGVLFISHAESLNCVHHGLTWIAPAVYRRAPQS